jgi:hypothetical protein
MIILGLVLLLLGLLFGVSLLYVIGVVLVVIGALFWIAGNAGTPSVAGGTTSSEHVSFIRDELAGGAYDSPVAILLS